MNGLSRSAKPDQSNAQYDQPYASDLQRRQPLVKQQPRADGKKDVEKREKRIALGQRHVTERMHPRQQTQPAKHQSYRRPDIKKHGGDECDRPLTERCRPDRGHTPLEHKLAAERQEKGKDQIGKTLDTHVVLMQQTIPACCGAVEVKDAIPERAPQEHSGPMMTKTICINQSNYIPWRGYFDLIRKSDEFVIFDTVQYTHRDWRNRNQIKTRSGLLWLTVPAVHSGHRLTSQRIEQTYIADPRWPAKHLTSFHHAYRGASCFAEAMDWLEPLYHELAGETMLSAVNERLIRRIAEYLSIKTQIRRTSHYFPAEALDGLDRTERLILLCKATGAKRYLTGPAAKSYVDEAAMARAGIEVEWMDYSGYRSYPQLWGAFEPRVSIVDLIFNTGSDAVRYLGRQPDGSEDVGLEGADRLG